MIFHENREIICLIVIFGLNLGYMYVNYKDFSNYSLALQYPESVI